MTVSSYRLDTVALHLIDRLEGARPTYAGRPDDAAAAFARVAHDEIDRIVAEHDEVIGEPGVGAQLRREVLETFLPRYTRLAQHHTALEDAGYRAWRGGDPVARAVTTIAALLLTAGVVRVVHHPVALVCVAAALLVPFLPELRRWYYRRQYASLLQEVVDDMARIQGRLDAYAPAELDAELHSEPAASARPVSRRPDKEPSS